MFYSKMKNGKYKVDFSRYHNGKRHRKIKKTARTIAEAKAQYRKLEDEHIEKIRTENSFIIKNEVVLYLNKRKKELSSSTFKRYDNVFRNHISPFILEMEDKGYKYVEDIDASYVELLKDCLLDRETKHQRSTSIYVYQQFSTFLEYLVTMEKLSKNYAKLVKNLPSLRKEERSDWTMSQFYSFVEYVEDIHLKVAYSILIGSGLRKSELFGLTLNNIEVLSDGRVQFKVVQQLSDLGKGKKKLVPLKTSKSKRVLKLNKYVSNLIIEYKNDYYSDDDNPEQLLFGKNTPSKTTYNRVFRNAIYKHNSEEKIVKLPYITPHDLRHSFATMMLAHGTNGDIYQVSRMLGHESITTTNRYLHTVNSVNNNSLSNFEDYINNSLN
jgi:integrase